MTVTLAQIERYVGLPYSALTMDCADLVLLVERELFGRTVALPGRRPRPLDPAEQVPVLNAYVRELAVRTELPSAGDLVLMLDHGQTVPGHAGVYFFVAHEPWVLHTTAALGCSCLHRMRQLPDFGLRVEGVYKWTI